MSRPRAPRSDVPVLLLTAREAAAAMSVSTSEIYRLIERGEIPTIHLGNSRRVPVDALRDLIARKLRDKAPAPHLQEHSTP